MQGTKGVGYLFYETTKGFHFRSWESLCVTKSGQRKRICAKSFRYVQGNQDPITSKMDKDYLSAGELKTDRITENYQKRKRLQIYHKLP